MDKIIQEIKKDFFSYRNGILADNLRKLYPENTFIFGLMVHQLLEISKKYPKNLELALKLWNEGRSRESRLIALYLFPIEEVTKEMAKFLFEDVKSMEEADLLSFKILRHVEFAQELFDELTNENISEPIPQYCFEMFKKNLNYI